MKTLILGLSFLLVLSCNMNQEKKVIEKETSVIEKPEESYNPEAKLQELGIELSTPSAPVANYVNAVRTGNLIFLSGKGS